MNTEVRRPCRAGEARSITPCHGNSRVFFTRGELLAFRCSTQVHFRFPKKIYGFPDFGRTGFFNLLNTLFAFLVERLQSESIVSVFLFVGGILHKPPCEKEQLVGVGWWIQAAGGLLSLPAFSFWDDL